MASGDGPQLPALSDLSADFGAAATPGTPVGVLLDEVPGPEETGIAFRELFSLQEGDVQAAPQGFVISKTRGGKCRRLHFVGGCWRVPGEHYRSFEDWAQQEPGAHEFNCRCADCFPAPKAADREEECEAEASESDGETSSEDSDVEPLPEEGAEADDGL